MSLSEFIKKAAEANGCSIAEAERICKEIGVNLIGYRYKAAIAVLPGMVSTGFVTGEDPSDCEITAKAAVKYADALLKELEGGDNE